MADMASHRPVAGAVTIYVRHPDNFVSSTVQSEDGTFRFDDLPPGSALLVAQADGFVPYAGSLSVAAGKPSDARVRLLLQASAAGRVLDGRGPVEGARIPIGCSETLTGSGLLEGFAGGQMVTASDGARNGISQTRCRG